MSDLLDAPSHDVATTTTSGAGSPIERLVGHGWWGAVWFVTGLVLGAGPLGDNSFLTHLATGRLILDRGFPTSDPYSFTAVGADWVVQSWGASVLYAGLEAIGPGAIRLLVGVVTGSVLAMLWRLTRPADGLVGRIALMALASGMQFSGWSERPQLLALALLALVTILVLDGRSPWWFVPIFALWVNLHGSFPVGVAAVALVSVPVVVEGRIGWRRAAGSVAAAVGGAVAGALASPYGMDLLMFPARMLGRSEVLRYINEWRRPELTEPATWFAIALGVVTLGSVLWRRAWAWLPLVVVFAGLAATSNRNLALASVVLIPAAAPGLAGLGSLPTGAPAPWRRVALVGAAATAAMAVAIAATPNYDLHKYPEAALRWMDSQGLDPTQQRHVLTHDFVGNYLAWRDGAERQVFLDDRAEVFGERIVADYVSLISDAADFDSAAWPSVLDRYDTDVVLFSRKAKPFVSALESSSEWEVVYSDPGWIVACRPTTPGC